MLLSKDMSRYTVGIDLASKKDVTVYVKIKRDHTPPINKA